MLYWLRHVFLHRMRRLLVIFLILLFPLNVLALSMSVALPQSQPDSAAAQVTVAAPAGDAFAGDTKSDIDPDEPPSVAELHDLVNQERCLHLAGLHAGAVPPHDAAPTCHSFPPPIKPPRLA